MKIAICDDKKEDAELLFRYCQTCKLPYEITLFSSASELLRASSSDFYDLIFLDIGMPDSDGYKARAQLVKMEPKPLIIFTTYSPEYAYLGYGIAFRCLPKPVMLPNFQQALKEALPYLFPKKLVLSYNGIRKIIPIHEILYIESLSHHIIFHLKGDKCFECKDSMEHMMKILPHPNFFQVHRSFCINLEYIDTLKSSQITMTNGAEIPVSRKKQEELQARFTNTFV